jgi:hypothetical protein
LTNRTPSAHHAPTVFETACRPFGGTFRRLEPVARFELAAFLLTGQTLVPNEPHGHGVDGRIRTGDR